ncbi:hypothetical protein [Bradyrhizobium sp. SZCCHNRI3052]|uniref:hypothetical protein n=1 Tax=Bradyrhizobium sp. SZCCHNRI3052 TaxID=3057295 RepID=UPI0029162CDC|nr:hypothetical protein [Bradyrhizobium sp. SZCCHNRI3052]
MKETLVILSLVIGAASVSTLGLGYLAATLQDKDRAFCSSHNLRATEMPRSVRLWCMDEQGRIISPSAIRDRP